MALTFWRPYTNVSYPNETLLDVRTPAEFAEAHAEGAINIPLQELPVRMNELRNDKQIIVYCRSGARSAVATTMLRSAGYSVEDCSTLAEAIMRVPRPFPPATPANKR